MTQKHALTDLDVVRAALDAEYEILEELGRGGMAIVYRARERQLDREVAVKVLPLSMTFDESLVERFQREARTAARLEHPHIVPIYRVGREGQVAYFVMQYLRGRSLSAVLAERGTLPVAEIRRILAETGSALGYAAAQGVVHRDVKPDNILLDESGRCVVTDFGIAKSGSDHTLTATGMSLGTPRYMSPEQARARAVDGRSDLYSLGIVAYECLVGRVPYDAEDAMAILLDHIQAPLPRPALRTSEEWELFEMIERLLAKRPEDRFQSADELLAALGAASGQTGRRPAYEARARRSDAAATIPSPAVAPTVPSPAAVAPSPASERTTPGVLGQAAGRALAAALESLRAQGPRVRAGLAAGRGLVAAQRPRARRAAEQGKRVAGRGLGWLRSRSPRFWRAAVGGALLVTGGYWAAHFALMHRSRCPDPATSFALLVDDVGRQRSGWDVDVYYDVCGLEEDTAFTTSIAVRRQGFDLRRIFGGGGAVRERHDDRADGTATRRHREVSVGALEPGRYALTVSVTDAQGRSRERTVEFEVR